MTNKGAVTDYSPEAAEAILSAFHDRVLQAIQDGDRVDDIILHDHLREAIAKTMEDPDSPWSEVTTRGASPTPVAMMVYDEHGVPVFDTTGMPYSKVKAKAPGKGPRAVVWPRHPQNIQGTDVDPTARANLMVAHWGAFANRLLRNYTRKYMFRFWKIEKRRRAIVVRENIGLSFVSILNLDLSDFSGQLTFTNVPVTLMMSQLLQWLLQHLDCLHSPLLELIEIWMSSMHQALLGKSFRPTSTPGTLVLEIWRNEVLNSGRNSDLMEQKLSMICTCKIWQMKRPKLLNKTLIDRQGYLRPQDPPLLGRRSQLQANPEPLCQVWKPNALGCIGI